METAATSDWRDIILHVIATSQGGDAVGVRSICEGLSTGRYRCVVAMPTDGGNVTPADFRDAGAAVEPWEGGVRSLPWAIRDLADIIRRVNPACIHAHGSGAVRAAWLARSRAGHQSTPLVAALRGGMTLYDRPVRRWVRLWMERRALHAAARVLAVSEAERLTLVESGMAPSEHVEHLPTGLRLNRYLELGALHRQTARVALNLSHKAQVIVMVARFGPPRDFKVLLKAFAAVCRNHPKTLLYLVGDGPFRPAIERQIRSLGLGRQVHLPGLRRDPSPFYAAADLFVLTATGGDGFPLVLAEAQAAGLPVIVTDVGGNREAVVPDESALLVPKSDVSKLTWAMETLLGDSQRRSTMGHAGRRLARRHFDLGVMIRELGRVYRTVIQEKGP